MQARRIVLTATLLVLGPLVSATRFGGICAAAPAPLPECSDGIDNDGDLLVDYPADPDCLAPDSLSESSTGDMSATVTDAGVRDLSSFSSPDGDVIVSPGPNPGIGGGNQPVRDRGCGMMQGQPSAALPGLALLGIGLLLARGLRRRA